MDTGNTHAEAPEHHGGLLRFFLNRTNRAPWSPTGIAILAVCFLPPAMLLHALNYARLGRPDSRRRALFAHFTVLLVFFWAAFFTDLADALFWFVSVAYAVHFYKSQDSLYKEHLRTKGTRASLVVPATLSTVAFGLVLVVVVVGYVAWWDAYFEKGVALIDEGRLGAAKKIFLRIADESGDDEAYAYWNLAVIQDERGDLPGAIRYMRKALDLEPKDAEVVRYLDELEAQLDLDRGYALIQEGKFDEAEPMFLRYLELFPDDADTLWNLAVILDQRGDVPGALERAQQSSRLVPGDPERKEYVEQLQARRQLEQGYNLMLAGKYDEAEDVLQRHLEVYPDDSNALWYLAVTLDERRDLAGAIEKMKRAVELDSGNLEKQAYLEDLFDRAS